LYESPHRLLKTLEQLAAAFGPDRQGSVSREISKMYEENMRDTLGGLIEKFRDRKIRGEIVIVVEGKEK
jgi:16S rRNA (cytidine1402-2'-O)-methyltransferase